MLNSWDHLRISHGEFLCIAAMVFCQVDEEWYMSKAICPDIRSVTLISWLQVSLVP